MSSARFRHDRKKDYKQSLDAEEQRRKRNEGTIKIRKEKKEENLLKKRNIGVEQPKATINQKVNETVVNQRLEMLPNMIAGVKSNDPQLQLDATMQFRKLLSIERNPPIEEVIAAGVVPYFVNFLSNYEHPLLQFEAAWALTNVASGSSDQTRTVIESGAVPILIQLLMSPNDDVREQAVWALGNIAGDSPHCRDFVLNSKAMDLLLRNLRESQKLSMLRNATWTLSNFCRGKPQPAFELVKAALPTLAQLIHSSDDEVLTDACWALSYLSDGPNDRIQAVIDAGVAKRLAELLMHPSFSVQTPALRTVGNIVTGDDVQTQTIINVSALPNLFSLLHSPKKGIRKEACWTLSNITAGNKQQIQSVLESNIIPVLIKQLNEAEFEIKKEAAWAISNATSGGSPEQIKYMVNCGCIKPLCELLTCGDAKIILVALEGLENILKVGGPDSAEYISKIEEVEGVDKLENLQNHQNNDIYEKVFSMLEKYFNAGEAEDQPSAAPQQNLNFNFGNPNTTPQLFKF